MHTDVREQGVGKGRANTGQSDRHLEEREQGSNGGMSVTVGTLLGVVLTVLSFHNNVLRPRAQGERYL